MSSILTPGDIMSSFTHKTLFCSSSQPLSLWLQPQHHSADTINVYPLNMSRLQPLSLISNTHLMYSFLTIIIIIPNENLNMLSSTASSSAVCFSLASSLHHTTWSLYCLEHLCFDCLSQQTLFSTHSNLPANSSSPLFHSNRCSGLVTVYFHSL